MSGQGVERLTADIDRTRMEMTATIEAIGDRLDPVRLVSGAKQTVRSATVGRVEEMANDAADMAEQVLHDATGSAQRAGSGLVETIRRNPVPAAMALIGVGWLIASRGPSSDGAAYRGRSGDPRRRAGDVRSASAYEDPRGGGDDPRRGESAGFAGDRRAGEAYPGIGHDDRGGFDVGEQLDERLGGRLGGLFDEVGGWTDQFGRVPDEFGRVPDQVAGGVRGATATVQRVLDDNPLGAGAVAIAVGAAIGMVLPPSEAERRVLGEAGARAIGTAESAATDAMRRLEDRVGESEEAEGASGERGTAGERDHGSSARTASAATAASPRGSRSSASGGSGPRSAASRSAASESGSTRADGPGAAGTAPDPGRKRSR